MRIPAVVVAIPLMGALAVACAGERLTESAPPGFALSPEAANLAPGGSLTLRPQPVGGAAAVDTLRFFWSSSAPAIASVNENGVVIAHRAGEARIAATVGGTSAVSVIVVRAETSAPPPTTPPPTTPPPTTPPPAAAVATVTVTMASNVIEVGQSRQATATLRAANGTVLTGRTVTWQSSDPSKATVSSTGVVTAKKKGAVTITATSEGRSGSFVLQVREDD